MITGRGREILSRFLLGHTSTYAGYVGIGVGGEPYLGYRWFYTAASVASNVATLVTSTHPFKVGQSIKVKHLDGALNLSGTYTITAVTSGSISFSYSHANVAETEVLGIVNQIVGDIYSDSTELTFETMRLPIVSRGFTNGDNNQLVFTAELPTNDRVVVTEAGLWTALDDPSGQGSPSRLLFNMDQVEGWVTHGAGILEATQSVASLSEGTLDIDVDAPIFATGTDNNLFQSLPRQQQYEGGRIGNRMIGLRGDSSVINSTDNLGVATPGGTHIHVATQALDFSRNNTDDQIKVALFVATAPAADYTVPPAKTAVLVEFLYSEDSNAGYANMYCEIDQAQLLGSRYIVLTKALSELAYSANFSWTNVRVVKISVGCDAPAGMTSDDFFVFIDGIRFDNVSTNNPLYGLTAYSIVRDNSTVPPGALISDKAEPGYIEFRLGVDVL